MKKNNSKNFFFNFMNNFNLENNKTNFMHKYEKFLTQM